MWISVKINSIMYISVFSELHCKCAEKPHTSSIDSICQNNHNGADNGELRTQVEARYRIVTGKSPARVKNVS